ncbi:MAG: hypothetical protein ACI8TF_002874 [Paracoccaceae bacterium]
MPESHYTPFYADLPFRGARQYVHSTSLIQFLSGRFGCCARCELVLKTWMASRVVFTPVETIRPGEGTGYAKILQDDGQEIYLILSEDTDHAVTEREPFDEDAIVERDLVADRILIATSPVHDVFIDWLIAANKKLITTTLNPQVKLIASKIVMQYFPDSSEGFSLVLTGNVGTKIFKTTVLHNNTKFGEVVFYGE